MAPSLLKEWVGGKQVGREWHAERRVNGGPGDSLKINLDTGIWSAFASGETGADIVSYYAHIRHLDQGPAADQVAQAIGYSSNTPVLQRTRLPAADPEPASQIPPDAPPLKPHARYGAPTAVYRYGDKFHVLRYDHAEGKHFAPMTWRLGRWVNRAYPSPRPLYNLEELAKHPDAPVLIVEGEKCVDAARPLWRSHVVLTWSGGAQAVKQSDFTVLKGRDVTLWPDADDPGRAAARDIAQILTPIASRVRVVIPDRDNGWDIADAIAEGMGVAELAEYARAHIRDTTPVAEYLPAADQTDDYANGSAPKSAIVSWKNIGLDTDSKNIPHPNVANASAILQRHEAFAGKIWLDTFRDKIFHTLDTPVPRLWTDADARRVTVFMQQTLKLPKFNLMMVHDAVMHAAECNGRNSLTDWLDALEWDGMPRLDTWLADTLGAELTPYLIAISRNWPIGMVARAYRPGCKMDNMPVLEGAQGRGKTTFLEVLGDPWYKSLPHAFGDKDFLQSIQGTWLAEIPDMTGFSKREHTQILATITIRNDAYRRSYGRNVEEHPRVAVFAATSETDDYLKDIRGRRRYWPIRCQDINIDALHAQRDQVFAEAVVRYRAGEDWYRMPFEADAEQLARSSEDVWSDAVLEHAEQLWANPPCTITSSLLLTKIGVELSKQDDGMKSRVARIMHADGWTQRRDKTQRYWRKPVAIKP